MVVVMPEQGSVSRESVASTPAVSIIMSEYNTPIQYLEASLHSILAQTFRDFELIIVDDRGANDVSQVANRMGDRRIRVVRNPRNLGLALSLTHGIEVARADWLARMDTDDLYDPEHLERLLKLVAERPGFAVYASRSVEFSDDGVQVELGVAGEKTARSLVRGDAPAHPATLISRSALLDAGGYTREYGRAEDFVLWCEILLGGGRIYVNDALTHRYRVSLGDYRKRALRTRGGEIRARLVYYPKLKAKPVEYLRIVRSILGGLLPPRTTRALRRKMLERNKVGAGRR